MDFKFRRASLDATSDATIILSMLDSFKMDASNKKNIVKETGSALVESLKAYNNSIIYFVELNNKPIGMAICFKSFSTFKAAQLLNIHDFYVTLDYQNRGIGGSLLKHIESDARKCGFCGITLEVKAGNTRALKVKYEIIPIGIIHSPYKTKEDCPIQGRQKPEAKGKIEVFPAYSAGLKTIECFSHIYLFYVFDRAGEIKLIRPTFLDDNPHGVFASRHPCRPNGLGMSIVKLGNMVNNILEVIGLDVLDGTPLIDIKPYIPKFDYQENASNGWVETKPFRDKPANKE